MSRVEHMYVAATDLLKILLEDKIHQDKSLSLIN